MRFRSVAPLVVLVAGTSVSAGTARDPWDWTTEERIAYLADYRTLQLSLRERPTSASAAISSHAAVAPMRSPSRGAPSALNASDRFLYEAIAVNMFSVSDKLPDPGKLREAERGCR
ncbi:MAG TPA: hypothetical protein VF698_08220 [Thermoanaerobaculia bacterium]|jgi:hypothetical protein